MRVHTCNPPPLSEIHQPRGREHVRGAAVDATGATRELLPSARWTCRCQEPAGRCPPQGPSPTGTPDPQGHVGPTLLLLLPTAARSARLGCFSAPVSPGRSGPCDVRKSKALVHGGPQRALCPGAIPARGPWGERGPPHLPHGQHPSVPSQKRLLPTESKYLSGPWPSAQGPCPLAPP